MTEANPKSEQLFEDLQLGKYLNILRRRMRWIVVPATAIFVGVFVFALRLPNTYHAETVILVDPQKVPDSVVPSTVNTTIGDRLSTVRQEIMSPTRLRQVIEDVGLYSQERAQGHLDTAIERMQRAIVLEIANPGGSQYSAFRIGYTAQTATEAAAVPNKLANMVIRSNVQARQAQSSGTADFLETELQETKRQLEEKEAELSRIKSANLVNLPEAKQYHLEQLTTLRNQLSSSQDRVSRAQQEKVYLQSMGTVTNPTVDLDADGPGGASSSPEMAQAQKLEGKLADLKIRYGPNHPDVRKAQNELDQLNAAMAKRKASEPPVVEPQKPAPARKAVRNPVIEAQLIKIDQETKEQLELQKGLQKQIDFHSSKLELEPLVEQQMAGKMRDYDTLRSHYNRLLDKKLSADMYTSLVNHEEGEHFVILDAAQVPRAPAGPNRFLFSLAGLICGLLGGLALAIVKEMTDPTVRDENEASDILGKAVMVGIPVITPLRELRARRMRLLGVMTATILASGTLGFVISSVMRRFS